MLNDDIDYTGVEEGKNGKERGCGTSASLLPSSVGTAVSFEFFFRDRSKNNARHQVLYLPVVLRTLPR